MYDFYGFSARTLFIKCRMRDGGNVGFYFIVQEEPFPHRAMRTEPIVKERLLFLGSDKGAQQSEFFPMRHLKIPLAPFRICGIADLNKRPAVRRNEVYPSFFLHAQYQILYGSAFSLCVHVLPKVFIDAFARLEDGAIEDGRPFFRFGAG